MVDPDVYRPLTERYARGFFATRDSEGGEYRTAVRAIHRTRTFIVYLIVPHNHIHAIIVYTCSRILRIPLISFVC